MIDRRFLFDVEVLIVIIRAELFPECLLICLNAQSYRLGVIVSLPHMRYLRFREWIRYPWMLY